VYPEWWGNEVYPDQSGNRHKPVKRIRSADPNKAKINRAIKRHAEDSLDKRLRMVYEGNGAHVVYELPDIVHKPNAHVYAYTKQNLASPITTAMPGHSNVPMTYSGPPCDAEIYRNQRRKGNGIIDQSRSNLVFGYQEPGPHFHI
jgi:L-lactate utilization protein LutC